MNKRFLDLPASFWIALLAVAMASLLAACGAQPATPEVATATQPPEATITPTLTSTLTPTRTLAPAPTRTPRVFFWPTEVPGKQAAAQLDKQGDDYAEKGMYDLAIESYHQAIVQYPWTIEAYYGLNTARKLKTNAGYLALLDMQIAGDDDAIAANPKDAQAYYQRGWRKLYRIATQGDPVIEEQVDIPGAGDQAVTNTHLDFSAAIADFDQAIRLDPQFAEAYHARGLARNYQSLNFSGYAIVSTNLPGIKQAIQDYQKAIAIQPDDAAAHNDLGTAYTHLVFNVPFTNYKEVMTSYRKAMEAYTQAIQLDPSYSLAKVNRGYLSYNITIINDGNNVKKDADRQLKQAIQDASDVLEDDPQSFFARMLRISANHYLNLLYPYSLESVDWSEQEQADVRALVRDDSFLFLQYDMQTVLTRVYSLSYGPERLPIGTASLGVEYNSLEDGYRLAVPDLLSPNAQVLMERANSGDSLVVFWDDLGRWFSLQVHPGSPGDWGARTWLSNNLQEANGFRNITVNSLDGKVEGFVYYNKEEQAQCATAVQNYNLRLYTATYCLSDANEENQYSKIRLIADSQLIPYDPVEDVLESFLLGLDISMMP